MSKITLATKCQSRTISPKIHFKSSHLWIQHNGSGASFAQFANFWAWWHYALLFHVFASATCLTVRCRLFTRSKTSNNFYRLGFFIFKHIIVLWFWCSKHLTLFCNLFTPRWWHFIFLCIPYTLMQANLLIDQSKQNSNLSWAKNAQSSKKN